MAAYKYADIEVTEPFDRLLDRFDEAIIDEPEEPFSEFVARYPRDADRSLLLHHAVIKNSPELMRWILANNTPESNQRLNHWIHRMVNPDGIADLGTPLEQAILLGNLEAVRILVNEFHANVSQVARFNGHPSSMGAIALELLSRYGVTSPEDPRFQIAEFLLNRLTFTFHENDVCNANLHAVLSDPAYARLQALVPPPFLAECHRREEQYRNEQAVLESLTADSIPA